jgi:hypothetical protein
MSFPNPSNPMPPFVGSFLRVSGWREKRALVQSYGIALVKTAEDDLQFALEQAAQYARSIVPVITGYLRSTIGWSMVGRYQATYYALAGYAGFVEYGVPAANRPPKPYMVPSLVILKQGFRQILIENLGRNNTTA